MTTALIGSEVLPAGVVNFKHARPVLAQNESPIATNATLRKDEWERIDDRVNEVLRERLTIVDDLRGRGLVTPLSLGAILRITERVEDFGAADLSFDGDTAAQRDRPSFLRDTVPVPVISKDFQINWRQLAASRERGDPLDTTSAELSTRKVRDRMQALYVNGLTFGPGGNSIEGLINATGRLTNTQVAVWTNEATRDIVRDVVQILETAYTSNLFGPFFCYLPKNYWAVIQDDYNQNKGDRTFMERILAFSDIEAVRPLDALPSDNIILLQMTRDVLDHSEAQAPTTIQWEKNPLVTNFRVLTVGGPQFKTIELQDAGTAIKGWVHSTP